MSSLHRTRVWDDILTSAAFRLTLRFAAVFVMCLLALDLALGAAATWYVERSGRAAVDEIIQELQPDAEREGADAVRAFIAQAEIDDRGLVISYQSAEGALLAGWPSVPEPVAGWTTFVPVGVDDDEALWLRSVRLGDGSWLNVAAESEVYHDIRELMMVGALWTIAIALPLALLSGALLSRAVLHRLAPIGATTDGVRRGELALRAPVTCTGDEFDRLAENINAMLDQIETLTKNLRNVSVGIAHELRTPLARIQNQLAQLGDQPDALSASIAQRTLAEIDAAMTTFDALLKIGQIESDAQRKGFEPVSLAGLVAELAEVYEPVAAERNKRLSAQSVGDVEIEGNRALITQMISNLLENAIEHTPSGTNIRLTLEGNGPDPRLIVEDDGPGIPEDERGEIFERFHRLERSNGRPGNGLGLSLVRSICGLHGFAIRLTSAHPGARFEIAV